MASSKNVFTRKHTCIKNQPYNNILLQNIAMESIGTMLLAS